MKNILRLRGDKVIWIIVVLLAMVSVLAVFSSSSYLAIKKDVPKTMIFLEQTRSVLLGFLALFVCYLIPLRWYRTLSFLAFGAAVVMLVMLYIPAFQDVRNGAVRGIKVGKLTFQAFEFVKVAMILYLARALEVWEDSLYSFKQYALKILLPVGAVCVLVLPNSFSSAGLIGFIAFLVLLFMDIDWKHLGLTVLIVVALLAAAFGIYQGFVKGKDVKELNGVEKVFNRFGVFENRVAQFADKDQDSNPEEEGGKEFSDEDLQSINAKVAISQGGIIGKGPGKSTQRYSLSMAFSDFIFAFIVEEYGLLGGTFVIFLYLVFLFRCIRIIKECTQTFSSVVVIGLAFLIVCQAFLHIMVNVGLFPVTGHTLPLISHGGTAYLILSGAFGIILSVSKQLQKQREAAALLQEEEVLKTKQEQDYE